MIYKPDLNSEDARFVLDKSKILPYVDLDNVLDKNIDIKPKLKYNNEIFSIESIIRETYGINIKCVK